MSPAWVEFPGDGAAIRAFLARPDDGAPHPAVVILHDWFGPGAHAQDVAQRFAREGYTALVPDLYARLGAGPTDDPAQAAALMQKLSSQQVLRDMNGASRWLRQQPFVDERKLGVVGFAMGASFALTLASHNSDFKGAALLYGKTPPADSLKYLVMPILYLVGDQDAWITKADLAQLQTGLKNANRPGEMKIYPGAAHGFFNDAQPDAYHADAARDAWQRTLAFLSSSLAVVR